MGEAAGLDYIKDKVAKRTEGIIFHQLNVRRAFKTLGTVGIESIWTFTL